MNERVRAMLDRATIEDVSKEIDFAPCRDQVRQARKNEVELEGIAGAILAANCKPEAFTLAELEKNGLLGRALRFVKLLEEASENYVGQEYLDRSLYNLDVLAERNRDAFRFMAYAAIFCMIRGFECPLSLKQWRARVHHPRGYASQFEQIESETTRTGCSTATHLLRDSNFARADDLLRKIGITCEDARLLAIGKFSFDEDEVDTVRQALKRFRHRPCMYEENAYFEVSLFGGFEERFVNCDYLEKVYQEEQEYC